MPKLLKRIWSAISGGSTLWGLLPSSVTNTLAPLAWTAAVMTLGFIQGVQGFWLLVGGSVVFAASITGLLHASAWQSNRRVEGKITAGNPRTAVKHGALGGDPEICLGFTLFSSADFPIQFDVKSIRSNIDDRIPKEKTFKRTNFTIPPQGNAWFDDHLILIQNPPKGASLTGRVEFEVAYGKPGNLKHSISATRQVHLFFDDDGKFKGGSWNESI